MDVGAAEAGTKARAFPRTYPLLRQEPLPPVKRAHAVEGTLTTLISGPKHPFCHRCAFLARECLLAFALALTVRKLIFRVRGVSLPHAPLPRMRATRPARGMHRKQRVAPLRAHTPRYIPTDLNIHIPVQKRHVVPQTNAALSLFFRTCNASLAGGSMSRACSGVCGGNHPPNCGRSMLRHTAHGQLAVDHVVRAAPPFFRQTLWYSHWEEVCKVI